MPFITKTFYVSESLPAYKFVMQTLQCNINQAQKILDKGRVRQRDSNIKKNQHILGDIELSYFEPCDIGLKPLFSNENFCVFDKPCNLLVHPKGRYYHYSLNDALKYYFGHQANAIHRIDKETSGLVLCAINPHTETTLKNLMMQHQIHKTYLAEIEGKLTEEILIDKPISTQKHLDKDLCIKSVIDTQGKPSQTQIQPLKYNKDSHTTLVRAIPLTGRTHQIRLHLAYIGHRILGDPLYGVEEAYSRNYLAGILTPKQYSLFFGAPYLRLNAHTLQFIFQQHEYYFQSEKKF